MGFSFRMLPDYRAPVQAGDGTIKRLGGIMPDHHSTIALLMAAGTGTRVGVGRPKQFADLGGRPMIVRAFEALSTHPAVDQVICVVAADHVETAKTLLPDAAIVKGGILRQNSVALGVEAALDRGSGRVIVHDAARPFVPHAVIDRLLAALETHDGAVPALPVVDTLTREDGEHIDRTGLHRVQTPQIFDARLLLKAHREWPSDQDASDDAQMVRRLGGRVALVQGDAMLDKITYPNDLAIAEARLGWETRTASGFDVHRLEVGEELWLGGILIPHDRGLSGHSDADVVLHALTDALLGTIAAGDIGMHFPPSDPKWRGAESGQFLRHAAELIAERGGRIDFVDVTLMCETPKIGPYRTAMAQRIADLLDLKPDRVSIKATTTERLGFTGRGEGIAAQAVATISLPRERA